MQPGSGSPSAPPVRSPGRPRLYEPDAERSRILSSALEVLQRSAGQEATVADILDQSGLSTRAFYRHFDTKEDVIRALYRRDAESFGKHLRRRVEAASTEDGLEVWVHETLGLAYDRRRADRMSALSSPMVGRVVAGSDEQRLGVAILVEPLHSVLVAGLEEGHFPAARPDLDVLTIGAMVWEALAWVRTGTVTLSRRDAVQQILRFSLPALRGAGTSAH
jgi:AcrR family transcriptional regulator